MRFFSLRFISCALNLRNRYVFPKAIIYTLVFDLILILSFANVARAAPQLLKDRPESLRPQLMVLGTVHMAMPNRDIQNVKIDDVLAPERQKQIAQVVGALASWHPTRIAIEWPQKDQASLNKRYADYRAGRYVLGPTEKDQLGLRLAALLHLPKIDAVDWAENPPGPQEEYDIEAGAKAAGEEQRLSAITDPGYAKKLSQLVQANTVAGFLRTLNQPSATAEMNRLYYDIAFLGTPEHNVGANWVGSWHARNFKIFANLVRLNASPKDRILVIFGVGHAYLLNQFSEDSHAFQVIYPDAILARAQGAH